MPVVAAAYEDLVGLIGRRIPQADLIDQIPMMGGSYEGEEAGRLHFEFFPNRPDLLSVEGLARACRAFFGVKPGLATYEVTPSGDTVNVDPTVRRLRPSIGFARVEGVSLDDARVADLLELQERLTTGPGRKRKKVAIGIHDAVHVRGPFTYKGVKPDEVRFVPLQMTEALTPKEILERHEKGRAYRHLVEGAPRVPIIVDRDGQVLSMPPVINGQLTALTTKTRDVLVDVTGTEDHSTQGLLNIVTTSLAERGGRIRSLEVVHGDRQAVTTPDLASQETTLPSARIHQLLGLKLAHEEVRRCLGRMGHDVEALSPTQGRVHSPAWRLDLLHVDDLVEDVGIGYGFDRFAPRLPQAARFGGVHPNARRVRRARALLVGLGFTEVVTLTLTSPRDALERVGAAARPLVSVANAVTADQSVLRPHLFTGLLGILRANKHCELPQSIFEVGHVVPPSDAGVPRNELRAAALRISSRATFAECKGLVEAFLRDTGRTVSVVAVQVPGFVPGRCAGLVEGGRSIGFFGEIHPETLHAFDLGAPVLAFEVSL